MATKITKNIHTSTFGGNPLASAGVVAVLKLLDDKQLNHIREISDYFFTSLHQIKSPHVMSIRGKGLMIGVEISSGKRNEVLKKLQQEKILVIPAGENMVRLLPPYIIEREHADNLIDVLNKIFDK
ncbi:TPA: aminotransferase class III-fold pyridoxal phosphate-dependent enzyme [Candidatus Woesearchaeota archaeon]|nr:aminotransferase class III-fold pyridoxal phosphate-dependent enzyme [Candidatus Woesearchaeota archaeon]